MGYMPLKSINQSSSKNAQEIKAPRSGAIFFPEGLVLPPLTPPLNMHKPQKRVHIKGGGHSIRIRET